MSHCMYFSGGFLFDKFKDYGFMLLFVIVFIMGGGQSLLTSAGSVWLLFVDVFIVGVMFGALHGGKGGEAQCSPRPVVRSTFVQRKVALQASGLH